MSVTVLSKKTVGFRSPYTGDTFQELTSKIIGRDGYMAGGATSDDAVNIAIQPITFIQGGLIAETEVPATALAVPVGAEPWFVVAAIPDDDPVTGVVFSATRDLVSAANGVVVAFKTGGVWQNPVSVDVLGAGAKAAETGIETGTQPYFTLSGDNMDEIVLNRGRVVDPDGIRRDLPRETPSSAKNFATTVVRAHASKGRQDHIVLRQRESHSPETKHIIGPLFDDGSYSSFTKAGTRQGYYAKRGGSNDEQWFAWGSALDLHIMGGPTGGGFADGVLLAAAGTVGEVWIAGQRASDDAIILLYTDGILLRMVSFDAATGAQIDASVTLDLDGNDVTHVRAEMDDAESIHIVYERDDGGAPTQQVYYTRRSTASATFATAAISHRIVHGSPTGKNDTFPDVDVDRQGNAHIVYTTGTTTDIFGDMVYAVYDQAGNLVVDDTHLAASAVGIQDALAGDTGFAAVAYTSLKKARVTVTDFDEVFAVVAGDDGGGYGDVLLFSPGFSERLGFPICGVGAAGAELYGVDIESTEMGELRIVLASSAAGFFLDIKEIGIDTVFAPDGLKGDSLLRSTTLVSGITPWVAGTDEDDPILRRGTIGDIRLSHRRDSPNAAYIYEIGTMSDGTGANPSQPHPKDLYLASFDVADDGGGVIPEEDIRIHNVRQKKMSYPFLVGIDGDFQGFNSVYDAVRNANINGGEIVVRKGDYRTLFSNAFPGTIALASGVTLRGEGQVVFEDATFQLGNSASSYSIGNIDGSIVERTGGFGSALRAGDVVEMATSGFHRIFAVLPPKGIYFGRLLLSASSPGDGVPVGASLIPYPAGNKLENIAIRSTTSATRISIHKSYQAVLRDVSFFGVASGSASTKVVLVDGAHHALLDNIDFSKLGGPSSPRAIQLDDTYRTVVRGCKGVAGAVSLMYSDSTNDTPSMHACTGMTHGYGGSRTTPLLVSGVDDGDLAGLGNDDDNFTNVGNLIKAAPNERISFLDNNILSGPLDRVPLSHGNTSGRKLPESEIDGTPAASILAALHIAQSNQGVIHGPILSGGAAFSFNVFPEVEIGAAQYYASGAYISPGGGNLESSATVADTIYYWHLNLTGLGEVVRSTSPSLTSSSKILIFRAKTNPGNTAFIEAVDLRRFGTKLHRQEPLTVGNGGMFATLQGAITYAGLQNTRRSDIVVLSQLDMTGGEDTLVIDFQVASNMEALTIRGAGKDAGIKWGQDTDLFSITGIASENATNMAGQKASLRIHGLLFDSTNNSGPSDTAIFRFNASYFTEVSIDGCRNQTNTAFNWNEWADIGCHADRFTIAENTIEVHGLGASSAGIYAADGSAVVKNLHIFRNTLRSDLFSVTTGTRGIVVGELHQCVWVAENQIENGRDGGGLPEAFATAISVIPFDNSGGPASGARWICDNVIANTEQSSDAVYAIFLDDNATTVGSPVYIIGNTIYDLWDLGIYSNLYTTIADLVIVDNLVYAQDNGIYVQTPAVVANNRVNMTAGGSTGIYGGDGNTVISGNRVTGVGQDGILSGGGGASSDDAFAIIGNTVKGQFTLSCIRSRRTDSAIVGNAVNNTSSDGASAGIYLNGFDRNVCTGNKAEAVNYGIHLSSGTDDCVVAGNHAYSSAWYGLRVDGDRNAITGNHVKADAQANLSLGAGTIFGDECAVTGNYFGAYLGASYGSAGNGMKALYINGPNCAISGNVCENRGTHGTKATVEFGSSGDSCTFVGNTLRNVGTGGGGSAVFTQDGGTANQYGTTGASLPGANKQSII